MAERGDLGDDRDPEKSRIIAQLPGLGWGHDAGRNDFRRAGIGELVFQIEVKGVALERGKILDDPLEVGGTVFHFTGQIHMHAARPHPGPVGYEHFRKRTGIVRILQQLPQRLEGVAEPGGRGCREADAVVDFEAIGFASWEGPGERPPGAISDRV